MPTGAGCGPPISTFYNTWCREEVYQPHLEAPVHRRRVRAKGFIALLDGKAVGLVHYLYHRSCWSVVNNCYLQDLFADPDVRGKGVGRR